jgi:hypothetical protein
MPVPTAIAFWDARRGLLGTRNCTFAAQCRAGTIELTTDGGRSFRVVLRTRRPVATLQTAGSDGAIATTDGGGALRTLDGGRSWRTYRLRFAASFATPLIGLGFRSYMVGRRLALAVLATADGGATWQRRASPCTKAIADSALVDLVTPLPGWIVCVGQPGAATRRRPSSTQVTVDEAGTPARPRSTTRTRRCTVAFPAMGIRRGCVRPRRFRDPLGGPRHALPHS